MKEPQESGQSDASTSDKLRQEVADWLKTEGYPTEYKTANIFRKHGFRADTYPLSSAKKKT